VTRLTFPLIAILGPTGSGKSSLALSLAAAIGGEIVNYDSVQLYRGLDIGSAKLSFAERRGIPHHLIDVVDASEDVTAGAYARMARDTLGDLRDRGRVPILVGGTGFYLRALLQGLSPAPSRNLDVRSRLTAASARRTGVLYRFLRRYDPTAAVRIHKNDTQKLIRAVELTFLSGTSASQVQSQPRSPLEGFHVLKIGLIPERAKLYAQINNRARAMFESGLIAETEHLLRCQGVPVTAKSLQALGYRQAIQVLTNGLPLAEAINLCQTKTRQYAKRQLTWFRREADVAWLPGFGTDLEIQALGLRRATEFLSNPPVDR